MNTVTSVIRVLARVALASLALEAGPAMAIELVSTADPGLATLQAEGSSSSTAKAVSNDGRYVAFSSDAANLVAGDVNGALDIFVRDLVAGTTILVSVDGSGAQANNTSFSPAISGDGRYVVFSSNASNLVAGDSNGATDVFVRDTVAGTTICISVDGSGVTGNGSSTTPDISADGRYVAFESSASNLVAGDSNGVADIFVRDIVAGTTVRASVDTSEAQGNAASFFASISSDGQYVAFASSATNLVSGDTNAKADIFVRDNLAGTTIRVSVDGAGAQVNGHSRSPRLSSDGLYIAFESDASNLVAGDSNGFEDIFLRDTVAGTTTRVSVDSSGAQGNFRSLTPSISANGRYVTFWSDATNLVAGDSNGFPDVFRRDTVTGTTVRASVDGSGTQANCCSYESSISADGRYVAFFSYASNLVVDDTNTKQDIFVRDIVSGSTQRASQADAGGPYPAGTNETSTSTSRAISADSRHVVFASDASNLVAGDSNSTRDIFIRDTVAGTITRVSVDSSGAQGNGYSDTASISPDARYVVFSSDASNLVVGDTNGQSDIFVRDTVAGTTTRVSVDSLGNQGNGQSTNPAISDDGRYVAFASLADNLMAGDSNAMRDIFLRDIVANTMIRVSVDSSGVQGDNSSDNPSMSSDGRYVAFRSDARNLVASDTNNRADVFVRDTTSNTTIRASIPSVAVQGNQASQAPSISANGRYVAFQSNASNMVTGDTNSAVDVFVRDTMANTTSRVSVSSSGTQGVGGSSTVPSISPSGRYIAFSAVATGLVAGDSNGVSDVFVRDTVTNTTTRVSVDGSGVEGNGASLGPSISDDGHHVVFRSDAVNLAGGGAYTDVFLAPFVALPDAPVIGTATAGDGQAEVAFTAPVEDGGNAISLYVVTAYTGGLPAGITASCGASPCPVSGLSNGTEYTFTVYAINDIGNGPESAQSNAVTPSAGLIAQTISFTDPSDTTYGAPGPTLSATGGASGNPVEFSSQTPFVCLTSGMNGATVTITSAGTCTIAANQLGNASYSAAPEVTQSFTIGQASQSINFTDPSDITFGAPGPMLSAMGGASGYAVEFSSDTPAVCLTSGMFGETVTIVTAGTCTIAANQIGNTNYSAAPEVTQSFTIGQASQSINFTDPSDITFGAPGPMLLAIGGGSGFPVQFSSNTPGICMTSGMNGENVIINSAGTCTIAANQMGNTNYSAAPEVTQSFDIGQASQTINFTDPSDITFGAPGPMLSAMGGASGNPVTFGSNTPSVCATGGTNGENVTILTAGTCTIAANQLGNTSYSAAPEVTQSFNIAQASQTISFTSPAPGAATVGGPVYAPAAIGGASGNPVVFTIDASASAICSISGGDVSFTSAGTCVINANQTGNANYSAAPQQQQSFAVTAGTTVPDAPTIGTATAGDASASVAFIAPGNDGGSAITDYTATSSPGGLTGSCASSPCTVSGLDNSTAYTFTVHATNAIGDSAESAASNSVTPAPGPLDPTIRVSVSSANLQGNDESLSGSKVISEDGRYVVFESAASNLVAGDTNGFYDVFLRDTSTGITTRISVDSAGVQGNDESGNPAISADGRFVAFASRATNLVAGDTNVLIDMFVHDTQTGATTRISVDSAEAQATGGESYAPALSADGRYVAFFSTATNLVASDTNSRPDIFVRDTVAGTTTRVSVASGGTQSIGFSYTPAISADGRYVAFQSSANNLVAGDTNATVDIFIHDTSTSTTTRASVAAGGVQATGGQSFNPSLSADGRYVAFVSDATNLVAGDTNATRDAFIHDTSTGTTRRISVDSAGVQTTGGDSVSPAISGDGRYVIFHSTASTLVAGDTNGLDDAFVHDNVTGATVRVSVGTGGAEANGGSFNPSISADGRYVAFHSEASNLVTGDTNGSSDVFRVSLQASVPSTPSIGSATAGNGQADVAFTAPGNDGGSAITGYTATAYIGGVAQALTGTCANSPCTVTGLSNGTAYTFTVYATNAIGDSPESAESNAVTPQGTQTISFTSTAPSGATVGGATYTPTATATSGLTVSFTIDASASSICSISSGTISFIGVGTCLINADQAGNAAWLPAQTTQQSFAVAKGNQTISFSSMAPSGATVGGATYTPTATATSGLAVTLAIDASSSTVCSISAGTVSFIGVGTCTINANQAGNVNYNAAPQVQQSFIVASGATVPGAPTIGTATAGNAQAMVTFTPPGSDGGAAIDYYQATSTPGGISGTCASSPCTVAGLANNTAYTFRVRAHNSVGFGAYSAATSTVTPALPLNISVTDETLREGGPTTAKTMTFKVKLGRLATTPVSVNITTMPGTALAGSDFIAKSQVGLTIPAGVSAATFVVSLVGDVSYEPTETFTVVISNPSSGTITKAIGVGTITDDDVATIAPVVAYVPLARQTDALQLATHLDEVVQLLCGKDKQPLIVALPKLSAETSEALADTLALRTGCAPYALHQAAGSDTLWLVDAERATATVKQVPGASWLETQPVDKASNGLSLMSPEAMNGRQLSREVRRWQAQHADEALIVLGQVSEAERSALRKLGLSELDEQSWPQAARALVNRALANGRVHLLRGESGTPAATQARDDEPMFLIIEP